MRSTSVTLLAAVAFLGTTASPAHAVPVAPPGFTLSVISNQLPDSVGAISIAGPAFGAFAGQAFLSTYTGGKVFRIDGSGAPHLFALGLPLLTYLKFGPGGTWGTDLYVSGNISTQNPNQGRVYRMAATGVVTDLGTPTPAGYLFGGGDIAFADGTSYGTSLYVGISAGDPGDCVSRFTPPSTTFPMASFPDHSSGNGFIGSVAGMEFGPAVDGWTSELYFSLIDNYITPPAGVAYGGLYRVSAGGAPTVTPVVLRDTEPRVQRMTGLSFGPGGAFGHALYAGTAEGKILSIASNGTVTTFVDQSGPPTTPSGTDIEFDAQGRLEFLDLGTHELWLLTPNTTGVEQTAAFPGHFEASPQPARSHATLSFALQPGASGTLECFDLRGRRVREWSAAGSGSGLSRVEWDGRDESGRTVPDGIYFARLTAGGHVSTARVIWAR